MKTDTIFYRIFQSFPSIFFEIINQSPSLANAYRFSSVEVKQLAFRIDGVFLPQPNTPDYPIYFAEVQFQTDPNFYSRFLTEIFLYLNKTDSANDWRGVVLFPTQRLDPGIPIRYQEFFDSNRIRRIYLNELTPDTPQSLGIETVKLIVEPEATATAKAIQLVQKARRDISETVFLEELLQLIATIIIYKFPKKTWDEVQAMFGATDITQTRVYQDGVRQGKLETIPKLHALGLTAEQIAQALDLEIEIVQKAIASQASS